MPERKRLNPGHRLLLALVLAYLALILALPLAALAVRALESGPGMLLAIFSDPAALEGLKLTLVLAGIALVGNGLVGVAAAVALVDVVTVTLVVCGAIGDRPFVIGH